MTVSVSSQPPTAKKSARRKNMAWSPNRRRQPRRKRWGRKITGAYQVFIQLWNVVPQCTVSAPAINGVNPAIAV
jgi:hypothetical protein